jgi:hypothetical protein
MGKPTEKKYDDEVALAKSVRGVQTRLTQARLKEIDAKYHADIAEAKKSRSEENAYVKRRDNHLIDRKIWNCKDQITLYDIGYCGGRFKFAVYYEQDKRNNPREEQFEHMMDMEFETLEAARTVYNAMCDALLIMMSPVTENHILGKPYKVTAI